MDELKFVLRCFVFSAAVLMLTQLKTGDVTIENRIEASLTNSRTATFVNKVADGGVQLIKDMVMLGKSTYQEWQKPQKPQKTQSLQLTQTKKQQPEVVNDAELFSEEE